MFTTNNHIYLYIAGGIFALSAFLFLLKKKTTSLLVLVAGLALYTLYLAGRGWITGIFIPNNVFDAPFFFAWCFGVLILIYKVLKKDDRWGYLLIPLILSALLAFWYVKGITPPTPNKQTLWSWTFFITETFAHACFCSSAVFAAVSLIRKNVDDTFHAYAVWGFILYCIAQVTGAVWCYYGWGNTFQWVPKHMGSTAIWLIYIAYLHLRFIAGWSSTRRSWWLPCIIIVLFLLGINATICTINRIAELASGKNAASAYRFVVTLLPSVIHILFIMVMAGHAITMTFGTWNRFPIEQNAVIRIDQAIPALTVKEIRNELYPDTTLIANTIRQTTVTLEDSEGQKLNIKYLDSVGYHGYDLHLDMVREKNTMPEELKKNNTVTPGNDEVCNTSDPFNAKNKPAEKQKKLCLLVISDPGLPVILTGFTLILIIMTWYFIEILGKRNNA